MTELERQFCDQDRWDGPVSAGERPKQSGERWQSVSTYIESVIREEVAGFG